MSDAQVLPTRNRGGTPVPLWTLPRWLASWESIPTLCAGSHGRGGSPATGSGELSGLTPTKSSKPWR